MPSQGDARPLGNLSSTYLLNKADLTDEQKLQLALARRQCWLRAAQTAAILAVPAYAITVAAAKLAPRRTPKGAPLFVPLTFALVGSCVGSHLGAVEGAPMAAAALRARKT